MGVILRGIKSAKDTMSNGVPFVDLKQLYLAHQEAFEKAIRDVCISGSYILGPQLESFEKRFAEYIGVRESIGVASGTDAIRLSCQALGIGPGDEVLIPANTFIASALGVIELGATAVPVDVDPGSFLMDMDLVAKKVTSRTKAIMPVHLYGNSMDMDEVITFADKHNLIIIEDACQSHGSIWKRQRTGSFGSVGCFSFYPAKNLGAFGDGGSIATNDKELAAKLRLLRNYGSTKKYIHKIQGTNSRLDSLQAAVLNVKLDLLDDWNRKRFKAACLYAERLKKVTAIKIPLFDQEEAARHVFHLFVIQCKDRDKLASYLDNNGIQCGIHYPVPLHLHEAFQGLGYKRGSFPVAEMLADRILSLPMFPGITQKQICDVVDTIVKFYEQ